MLDNISKKWKGHFFCDKADIMSITTVLTDLKKIKPRGRENRRVIFFKHTKIDFLKMFFHFTTIHRYKNHIHQMYKHGQKLIFYEKIKLTYLTHIYSNKV